MAQDRHPNKAIRAAIEYATAKGWRVQKSGPRAHVWGQLYCPETSRDGCIIRVFSTPRSSDNHANQIRRQVDRCPHATL